MTTYLIGHGPHYLPSSGAQHYGHPMIVSHHGFEHCFTNVIFKLSAIMYFFNNMQGIASLANPICMDLRISLHFFQ